GASSRGVLMVEPDAAPARVLSAQHAPGRPGAPPGGQYEPPARSSADGWPAWFAGQRKARPGPEGRAPQISPDGLKLVWVARREAHPRSREGARALTNEGCATRRAIPLAVGKG